MTIPKLPRREARRHHAGRLLVPVHVANVVCLFIVHGVAITTIMPALATLVFVTFHITAPRES